MLRHIERERRIGLRDNHAVKLAGINDRSDQANENEEVRSGALLHCLSCALPPVVDDCCRLLHVFTVADETLRGIGRTGDCHVGRSADDDVINDLQGRRQRWIHDCGRHDIRGLTHGLS